MEESFRNSLIIISAIVIGGIFVHGLWTIRKNKNPYKLKTNSKDIEIAEKTQRDFDRSGFDRDGVSQVKVISKKDQRSENQDVDNSSQQPESNINTEINDKIEPSFNNTEADVTPSSELLLDEEQCTYQADDDTNVPKSVETAEDDLLLVAEPSVYSHPVSKPKPVVLKKEKTPLRKTIKKSLKKNIKRDQIEINFGDTSVVEDEIFDNSFEHKAEPNIAPVQTTIEPEVLAISVITPQGQIISGAALLPSILTLGMKFGEMDVFHRHEDNAGNGKVTFSLVNALNPGTFDLDNMENFVTQGVSLFMTLPNAGNAFEVFDQMLNAAKQLASEFNGQLLDDKRSVLTKQTEQHYITRIREFERKSRISSL